jgi:hypothetical protein
MISKLEVLNDRIEALLKQLQIPFTKLEGSTKFITPNITFYCAYWGLVWWYNSEEAEYDKIQQSNVKNHTHIKPPNFLHEYNFWRESLDHVYTDGFVLILDAFLSVLQLIKKT